MDTPISTEILLKYLTSSPKGILALRREAVRRENCQKFMESIGCCAERRTYPFEIVLFLSFKVLDIVLVM